MLVYFEGIDGVGKSTQIELLKQDNPNLIITKEPGGTNLGEKLRDILLNKRNLNEQISKRAEILLFLADRAEHFAQIIQPNLDKIVISDRGFISGISYALANSDKFDLNELINLNKFALNDYLGDKFVFFKADENLILKRLKNRNTNDEIENRGIKYLIKVQEFMEKILLNLNCNYLQIDAALQREEIFKQIRKFIYK